jgi:branched-chain amino acid transport system substrate-binding protein
MSKHIRHSSIETNGNIRRGIIGLVMLIAELLGVNSQTMFAQGVTESTITIGQSGPLTGVLAASYKEALSGAQVYFDIVNKRGGINGRKIVVESLDDKQDPRLAADNTRILIEEKKVLALFMYRTTPAIEAALPMAEKAGVPFLFPQVGSAAAYNSKIRYCFTIRAPYQAEAQQAIEQLVRLGATKIAIFAADDAFGRDGTKGAELGMQSAKIKPVTIEKFDNKSTDVTGSVTNLIKAKPQAVLIIANARATADLIKKSRLQDFNPTFITLSNTSSQVFIDDLGDAGRGVGIMQVFPSPTTGSGVSIEFAKALLDAPDIKASYATLQGYLSAKVLVEALRRAGKKPSRESLVRALEEVKMNFNDFRIHYAPNMHHGSNFLELSIVGKGGKIKL